MEIAGAEIKVTKDDADKTLVDSWTSEEGKNHIIKGVTFGDYILTEVNAPEGYDKVTTEIKFKVNKDGSVSLKETYTNAKVNFYGALQITNEPTKFNVSISKTDAVSGEEIAGAEIKVTKDDKDKTEVDSWTSKKNETHKIEGVTFGNYVLTEVNAPEGYDKVNTEVRFSVDKSGKVTVTSTNTNGLVEVDENGVLVIKNIPYVHGALISKQDLESGEEIEGAVITITKADDETAVVDSWTSEAGKKHEIQNIVAGDYVLIEETSPEGYVKVTSKIEFTVDENGKITVTSKETDGVAEVDKNGVLVIKNAPVKHEVAISKVDATDGSKELEGATIVIYNEKNEVVDTWVSADAAHTAKLSAGRYKLKETVAPDDYEVVESEVVFDVDKTSISEDYLPAMMYIAFDCCYDLAKQSLKHKDAIFMDEVWLMMQNEDCAKQVKEMVKIIRGYGSCTVLATQDIGDFLRSNDGLGESILAASKIKFFLRIEDMEINNVARVVDLNANDKANFKKFPAHGRALLMSDKDKILIDLISSEEELKTYTTDVNLRKKFSEMTG